jgi:hypothetical protein
MPWSAGNCRFSQPEICTGDQNRQGHLAIYDPSNRQPFHEQLGCYEYDGIYGKYYDHNGWLHNGGSPDRGLNTGIIHLADGYDALLLVNAQFVDTMGLMIEAFEA